MNRLNKLNDVVVQVRRYEMGMCCRRQIIWYYENGFTTYRRNLATHYQPLALTDRVVSHFSAPGALVVVPFAGRGTGCLSALRHGRSCWGAEIKSEYVQPARTRLQAAAPEPGH